jgi:hypothetical protein
MRDSRGSETIGRCARRRADLSSASRILRSRGGSACSWFSRSGRSTPDRRMPCDPGCRPALAAPAPRMGHGRDGRELAGQIARIALVSALLGGFGVVVGALVRNQVVAVVGMLLLSFVVEPAVIGLVPEVGRYGPFVALPTAAVGLPEGDAGLESEACTKPVVFSRNVKTFPASALRPTLLAARRGSRTRPDPARCVRRCRAPRSRSSPRRSARSRRPGSSARSAPGSPTWG